MDDQSHKGFFANKAPKMVLVGEDENVQDLKSVSEAAAKQALLRTQRLQVMVNDTVGRVKGASSPDIMRVTWDDFSKMRTDSDFEQLGKYAQNLTSYLDKDGVWQPRRVPLRPLLENEVGMYHGKIVVLANNPGDGKSTGTIFGYTPPPAPEHVPVVDVEPDPFPSTRGFSIVGDDE